MSDDKEKHPLNAITALLKNPALGNSGTGLIVGLLGILAVNPDLSPFAYADHAHDISPKVQAVITDTVKSSALRTSIANATREIDDYTTQIELSLCIHDDCAFEKSQLKRAINRKGDLQTELRNVGKSQ